MESACPSRDDAASPSTLGQSADRNADKPASVKEGGWKHCGPPPAGQHWRGPTRGSGKWLAAALEIDYKTLKRRDANGSLWVRPIDGKTLDLWTQSIADDDKLLTAKKKLDETKKDT